MQAFTVRVEGHRIGHKIEGAEFKVKAENETIASDLAKLMARDKWPGCTPIAKGARPSGSPFEQDPATNPPVAIAEGDEPDAQVKTPEVEDDLLPERQIRPRKYAEWKAMKWFRLRAFARKAVAGQGIDVPDMLTALRLLQERNLVAP